MRHIVDISDRTLVSRKQAKAEGRVTYFTGKPCVRGHLSPRRTYDKRCVMCDREKATKRYFEKQRSKYGESVISLTEPYFDLLRRRKSEVESFELEFKSGGITEVQFLSMLTEKEKNRYIMRIRSVKQAVKNDLLRRAVKYRSDESYRERVKVRNAEWHKNNPHSSASRCAKRRAAKLNRTPAWVSEEMRAEMRAIYCKARELSTGDVKYEVDHIVPLQGKLASGLHVPWNLRIIEKFDNRSKHAQFDPMTFDQPIGESSFKHLVEYKGVNKVIVVED